MIGIGIGVGLGKSGGAAMSLAASSTAIQAALGAACVADWCIDNAIIDGSNNITAVPSTFGALSLAPAGDGGYFTATVHANRRAALASGATNRFLWEHTVTFRHVIVVAEPPSLPAASTVGLVKTDGNTGYDAAIIIAASASSWYASGWAHYTNGTATDSPGASIAIYEASKPANSAAGIQIGTWPGNPVYPTRIYRIIPCTSVPSNAARAAVRTTLLHYYNRILP